MTNSRRTHPVPQLQCVGGSAGCSAFTPRVVQCYNRGSDGYDVQVNLQNCSFSWISPAQLRRGWGPGSGATHFSHVHGGSASRLKPLPFHRLTFTEIVSLPYT